MVHVEEPDAGKRDERRQLCERDDTGDEGGGAPGKRAIEWVYVFHGTSRFASSTAAPPRRSATRVSWRLVFVTFEGADGSGKSTQAELLRAALAADGREVVLTREPGGTELGERIRELILDGGDVAPWAEATLFAAARAQLVEDVIAPALARGADVVCDRYLDSSLAYQGIARGIGVDQVLDLNLQAIGGLLPDRTFLLLLDPQESVRRSGETDRIEREGDEFRLRVDSAYRDLAGMFPRRIVAVDGSQPAADVAREIRGQLRELS